MQTRKKKAILLYVALMLLLVCMTAGCSKQEGASEQNEPAGNDSSNTLVIGAYSVAKDAVGELLPKFQEEWKAKTGQTINFQESYEASGTQARAIVGGFEADVALLAMESDIEKLVKADLVSSDWKQTLMRA